MIWRALLGLLLVGCYSLRPESRPVTEDEAEVIGGSIVYWGESKLPPIKSACVERVKSWRVAYLRGDELKNLCTKDWCFLPDIEGNIFKERMHPTAVIPDHNTKAERHTLLRCAVIRWLGWCSGLGEDPLRKNRQMWALEPACLGEK